MEKRLIALSTLLLTGCVSKSDIVPAGKDSFMVTVSAHGPASGSGRIEAIKSANAYCAASKQHMIIRRFDNSGIGLVFDPVTTMLIFSCVDDNDPEWQRPNLHPDPTTVIEDTRH